MKKAIIIAVILSCFQVLWGQTPSEALRYSMLRPEATSRALACGNGITALGADFTAASVNPAGIGLFRKSDGFVSFGLHNSNVSSTLRSDVVNNPQTNESRLSSSFQGMGVVFYGSPVVPPVWKNINLSICLTKLADFDESIYMKGQSHGSITDRFLELALDPKGVGLMGLPSGQLDDFEAGLAYEAGAIFESNNDPNHPLYTTDLLAYPAYVMPKEQTIRHSGSIHELSFGLGGNYKEIFAVGFSLHIPLGSFRSTSTYSEQESKRDTFFPFRSLEFKEKLETEISGFGCNLGIIYKPFKFLRLGVAWQSPRILSLKDEFNTSLDYRYFNGRRDTTLSASSPDGTFDYKLTTPMRTILSAALIGPIGFLSADMDIINPKHASFNLTSESDAPGDYEQEQFVNSEIDKQYKLLLQYRFGAELALHTLRLRAGAQMLKQPYKNSSDFDHGYSFGAGYRGDRFYVDLAYQVVHTEQSYTPYLTGNSDFNGDGNIDAPTPLVDQKLKTSLLSFTMGWKF